VAMQRGTADTDRYRDLILGGVRPPAEKVRRRTQ